MPAGPAHWGSYAGETLEKVMAVLVAQDFPDVRRRTPSSGDGGVDLYRPVDGGYHVTQVKGFTGRLGSNQKRQIEKSFERLTSNPRLDRKVVEVVFTGPTDLTEGEQRWFDELVADAPFPCTWEGEVAWNSRAAQHPQVIDYFFSDGRERVARSKAALADAFSSAVDGNLSVADVSGHLALLRERLNREDPHYVYDFLATSLPPVREQLIEGGAVMSATSLREDGTYVTVVVRPRHRYALEDAPIQGNLQITVSDPERGIDIRDEIDAFTDFGRGLTIPDGALAVEMSAPGGLGGSLELAGGILGPRTPVQSDPMFERLRMRAVHPDEGLAAELLLTTETITVGEKGGEIVAKDDSGCFTMRLQLVFPSDDRPGSGSSNFTLSDLAGAAISDVSPAVRLLAKLTPPHEVQICPQYGNKVLVAGGADQGALLSPADLEFFDDLQTVQDHVATRVVVPAHLSAEESFELHRVAQMLRGELVVEEWETSTLGLNDDADRNHVESVIAASEGALVISGQGVLQLDGAEYDVGVSTRIVHSVRLADDQPSEGIAIVPGEDNRTTFRYGAPPFEEVETGD